MREWIVYDADEGSWEIVQAATAADAAAIFVGMFPMFRGVEVSVRAVGPEDRKVVR